LTLFVWLLKSAYQDGVLKQIVIGPKVTNEDGSYSFDTGLEVNRRYYVFVDRTPPDEIVPAAAELTDRQPIEVPMYFPSATRMDSATAIVLQPGEDRERVDIKIAIAPFYCVEGKIQISGKPASADFAIYEAPLAGTRLARMRSSAGGDGKYHVCGLSPGAYKLSMDEGFTEFSVSGSDLQHIDLSMDTAHPKMQIDWDGPAAEPDTPKLNDEAEATLRTLAVRMGMDTPSDDDLRKLATRFARPDPGDTELRDAVAKLHDDPEFGKQIGNLMSNLLTVRTQVAVILAGIGHNFFGPIRDRVPSGDYALEIHGPDDSFVKEVTYDSLKIEDGILRIAPAASGTIRVLMARGAATLAVAVAAKDGNPAPNSTVILVPDSVTTVPALSRVSTHGQTDQNGNYTCGSLAPGKYRVLATPQSVRWDVPDDLERVLLVMFQAQEVALDAKAMIHVTLAPIPIY
jgi:hypothetical protein